MNQYLIFQLNNESYALNLVNIREIIEYKEPSEVPNSEPHVLGMIKIRDEIITLMDSKAILNTNRNGDLKKGKILIFENGKTKIGVVVDEVSSVVTIEDDEIMPSPLIGMGINQDDVSYVKGVINRDNKLIIIIDVTKTKLINNEDNKLEMIV